MRTDCRTLARRLAAASPLRVDVYRDESVEQLGYLVTSAYVEFFWLPIIGPSALLTARRLVTMADTGPATVPLDELAGALGLGRRHEPGSPVVRTLVRLVYFDLAAVGGDTTFYVRRALGPLPARFRERLPASLAAVEERWRPARAG